MSQEPPDNPNIKRLKESIDSVDIPKIYFNGFVNQISQGDIIIALECNSKPVATLNASYTVAKTLVQHLNRLIQVIESASGNNIMTTEDIDKSLKALSVKEPKNGKSK